LTGQALRAAQRAGRGAVLAGAMLALALAGCGGSGSGSRDTGGNSGAPAPGATVGVSGVASYEFVPPNASCFGLNFSAIETRPVRGATVQLIDAASGNVLGAGVTSDSGAYAFDDIAADRNVRLRIRAELKRLGSPGWDVEVRDNFIAGASDVDNPPPTPLTQRPLYVFESSTFSTGSTDLVRDVTATTGWDGNAYGSARAAAPFAILDAIYSAMQFIIDVDPGVVFPPLDAYWSVNNTLAGETDVTAGELPGAFYRASQNALFLPGDADVDTEEFDDHVIVHEWGHYFEDVLSRSDSFGGPHRIGDALDARLAFGEGWATAFAGMALGNPIYCDTGPAGSLGGFGIGADDGSYKGQGWYDEISVVRVLYDLYDETNEAGDSGSIGFEPIYDVMTGPQRFNEAFTTIFSFAEALRDSVDADGQALLSEQLAREFVDFDGLDRYGSSETNDAGGRDVLPVYTPMSANGAPVNVCVNSDFDPGREGNKLAEYRYLAIDVPSNGRYDVEVATTTPLSGTQSDPDIFVARDGIFVAVGGSGVDNRETVTVNMEGPDVYVAALREFRYSDADTPAGFPGRVCYDVTVRRNN